MAQNPNPEFISEVMQRDFGTAVLITNAASDRYMKKVNSSHDIKENLHPVDEETVEPFCGGKGGWDNFVERWHE